MENSEARKRREAREAQIKSLEQRELDMLMSFGSPITVPEGSLVRLQVAH